MILLRDYQQESVAAIYRWFGDRADNPLIVLPTGAGKSLVIAAFCQQVLQQWPDQRILVVTHVKELVQQNHDQMLRVWPEAPAGIYSAGIGRRDHDARILFAGIQSVWKQAAKIGWCDLILVDEAHRIPRSGDGQYMRLLQDMRSMNPDCKMVGLTATPYRLDSGRLDEGEDAMFGGVAHEVEVQDLIDAGYLSRIRSRAPASGEIDTTDVRVQNGEFQAAALEAAAMDDLVVDAAVAEMLAKGRDRKAWLVFACGVRHAGMLVERLRAADVETEMVVAATPTDERDRIVGAYKAGELRCLVNVGVFTTGFDAPHVDLIGVLRPTLSPGLFVQMVGRGLRLSQGKNDCLVLDFGGNFMRHGPIDDVRVRKPGQGGGEAPVKTCKECQAVVAAAARECPECGAPFPELPMVRHDERPDEEAVALKAERQTPQIRKLRVTRRDLRVHVPRDAGKRVTLRVDYHCGLTRVSQWLCFGHDVGTLPWRKAASWWRQHGGAAPEPTSVSEANLRQGEIAPTIGVTVDFAGEWPQVLSVRAQGEPGEWEPDDAERAPLADADLQDIPF